MPRPRRQVPRGAARTPAASRSGVRTRSPQGTGHDLDEVRGRSTDRHDRRGRSLRCGGEGRGGCGPELGDLAPRRRIVRHVRRSETRATDPQPGRARPAARAHDHQLRAPAADVHDEQIGLDRASGRRAEEREQPFLAMVDDVERDPGRVLDGDDHGPRVRGAAQRLRPHERDPLRTEPARRRRVPGERLDQRAPGVGGDQPPDVDERSEPEQRRFVEERHDAMPVHAAHEQVRRVRTDVDGGADRAAGEPRLVSRCPVPSRAGSSHESGADAG